MKKRTKIALGSSLLVIVAVAITAAGIKFGKLKEEPVLLDELRCIIDTKRHNDSTRIFVSEYNYDLLKRCTEDNGIALEASIAERASNSLDSLRLHSTDLVVSAWPDEDLADRLGDSLIHSPAIDSSSVWVMRREDRHTLKTLYHWIHSYADRDSLLNVYTATFNNPLNAAMYGRKRSRLSPYDALIRTYSAEIGWDWRLLAALIYQESRFRIDLRSNKGAEGLMQMIPQTASRYEMEDLLDPEINISTGVRHLGKLQRLFRRRVNDPDELRKVTMAAYNAGEGHIRDCFYYADWKGVNDSTWAGLCAIMPALADSSIFEVDTVKCGMFRVNETISYVDNILSLYDAFCTIHPSK